MPPNPFDRFRELPQEAYDVAVIGAGMGGLTAAALLARRGYSVLVADMHYVLGGCASVFHRVGKGQGYMFDVGLHYLGDCGATGAIPTMLRGMGIEDVRFLEMDADGFDTLCFPDFEFRIPRGMEAFRQRLIDFFPHERHGIDRYLRLVEQVWRLMGIQSNRWKAFTAIPSSMLALRYAHATVGEFLDTCTRDPRLRAVLTGQLGVYHQPPSRASLMGHAGVTMHYLQGAFYPAGGGQELSDRIGNVVEQAGGKILLRTKVTRIIVEKGRAAGVELENKAIGKRQVRARIVVSNADFKSTFLTLIGQERLRRVTVEKVRGFEMSPAMGVVYLGLDSSLSTGLKGNTNLRIYPGYDFEAAYRTISRGEFCRVPNVFVGNATLKDPGNVDLAPAGHSNLQLMSVVPSSPSAWGVSAAEAQDGRYRRSDAYLRAKQRFADAMVEATERVMPGIAKAVVYREVSTPLTLTRYTGASNGTSYGLAITPGQFLHKRPAAKTEIPGLYVCGASTRSGHGIFGAMTSGVEAAAAISGRTIVREVFRAA